MSEQRPTHAGTAGARRRAERVREQRTRRAARRSPVARLLAACLPSQAGSILRRQGTGAAGEQQLAASLAERCPSVPLLHDRRAAMSPANIDHVALAPTGVFVIDTTRYEGRIEVRKPLFGAAKLRINGRDRTHLIEGLDKQVRVVRGILASLAPDVPVHGCVCFVAPEGMLADSGLPLVRTLAVNGYPLYNTGRLARRLNRRGPLTPDRARALQAILAERLPAALGT